MCKSCANHPETKSLWPVTHTVSPDRHCSNAWQCMVVHSYIMQFVNLLQATPADRPHGIIVWRTCTENLPTHLTLCQSAPHKSLKIPCEDSVRTCQKKCEKEPNSLPKGHTTRMTRVSVRHIACSWIPCLRKAKFDDSSHVISQFHVTPILTPFI